MKKNINLLSLKEFFSKTLKQIDYIIYLKYNDKKSKIEFEDIQIKKPKLIFIYIENINYLIKISHDKKFLYDPLYNLIELNLKYDLNSDEIYIKKYKFEPKQVFKFNEITIKLINEINSHFEWISLRKFLDNLDSYTLINPKFRKDIIDIVLLNKDKYLYEYLPIFIKDNILSYIPTYGCYLLKNNTKIDKYFNIIKIMGRGSYGSAYAVTLKNVLKAYYESKNYFFNSNNKFILKKLNKKDKKNKYTKSENELFDIELTSKILHEVKILELINDPYINKCFGCFLEYDFSKHKYNIYILLEFAGEYDLKEIIKKEILSIYLENVINELPNLLDTLKKLHNKSIYHRDIKIDNIVYNHINNSLKLVDFGLACNFNYGNCSKNAGTQLYLPPNYKDNPIFKKINQKKKLKMFDNYAFALTTFILINKKFSLLLDIKEMNNINLKPFINYYNKSNKTMQNFFDKIIKYLIINPIFADLENLIIHNKNI